MDWSDADWPAGCRGPAGRAWRRQGRVRTVEGGADHTGEKHSQGKPCTWELREREVLKVLLFIFPCHRGKALHQPAFSVLKSYILLASSPCPLCFPGRESEVPCSRSVLRSEPGGMSFSNKVSSESSVTQDSEIVFAHVIEGRLNSSSFTGCARFLALSPTHHVSEWVSSPRGVGGVC